MSWRRAAGVAPEDQEEISDYLGPSSAMGGEWAGEAPPAGTLLCPLPAGRKWSPTTWAVLGWDGERILCRGPVAGGRSSAAPERACGFTLGRCELDGHRVILWLLHGDWLIALASTEWFASAPTARLAHKDPRPGRNGHSGWQFRVPVELGPGPDQFGRVRCPLCASRVLIDIRTLAHRAEIIAHRREIWAFVEETEDAQFVNRLRLAPPPSWPHRQSSGQ